MNNNNNNTHKSLLKLSKYKKMDLLSVKRLATGLGNNLETGWSLDFIFSRIFTA